MSMIPFSFEPTRAAGLNRLAHFAPHTGQYYSANRNTDEGVSKRANVSMLSSYLRFRMINEEEVLQAVLAHFTLETAEKFIQEVFWRAYFKGFLETRPQIWRNYLDDISELQASTADYIAATSGQTGIDCFDYWVGELKTTGYLHNHARMWFASIWIFTLKLPWQLGADFMYRHLIDGDPASNTLSWRWVGGLHTKGKTYLARPDNIAKYTNGRFQPKGLASVAMPLQETHIQDVQHLPHPLSQWPEGEYGLLVTSEDLVLSRSGVPTSVAIPIAATPKPGGRESNLALNFRTEALNDAANQYGELTSRINTLSASAVLNWCHLENIKTVAVAYAPVGPEADAIAEIEDRLAQHDINLLRVRRQYDALAWPHSTKGFFALKQKLPQFLQQLKL